MHISQHHMSMPPTIAGLVSPTKGTLRGPWRVRGKRPGVADFAIERGMPTVGALALADSIAPPARDGLQGKS